MTTFPGHKPSRRPRARAGLSHREHKQRSAPKFPFCAHGLCRQFTIDDLLPNDDPIRAAVARVECLRMTGNPEIEPRRARGAVSRLHGPEALFRVSSIYFVN